MAAGVGRTNCYCRVVCVCAWLLAWGVPTVIVVLYACVRVCVAAGVGVPRCVACVCAWMLVWDVPTVIVVLYACVRGGWCGAYQLLLLCCMRVCVAAGVGVPSVCGPGSTGHPTSDRARTAPR